MTREEAIKGLTSLVEVRRKYGDMQTMRNEIEAIEMAIKALELIKYIEQRYEEEFNERREYYADGRYHSLSICDGASYALRQVLDKWKESVEDKK